MRRSGRPLRRKRRRSHFFFPTAVATIVAAESTLPAALTDYVERMQREQYDYSEHSRVGAEHGEQVSDETCQRFCVLGTTEQHVEKLRRLEAAGVDQWNIYLMTSGQEETLEVYGSDIIPRLTAP